MVSEMKLAMGCVNLSSEKYFNVSAVQSFVSASQSFKLTVQDCSPSLAGFEPESKCLWLKSECESKGLDRAGIPRL